MSMTLYFLDVGQGDSTFVILPNGETMLVDCDITGGLSEFDQAHPVVDPVEFIEPLLRKEDTRPVLDHLVVTHPHDDHYSGFDMLSRRYRRYVIRHIWESGHRLDKRREDKSRYYDRYEYVLENPGETTVRKVCAGRDPVDVGGAKCYFFGPSQYLSAEDDQSYEATHSRCVVLKLVDGDNSVLFAGDSDLAEWRDRIVPYYSDERVDNNGKRMPNLLRSSVLHASHHGSRSFFKDAEDDEPYTLGLRKVSPDYTIISVGPNGNKHGHPHADALRYYRKYTTDEKVILTRGGGVKLELTDRIRRYDLPNQLVDVEEDRFVKIRCCWVRDKESGDETYYPSGGAELDKELKLVFRVEETNVPKPQKFRWLVQNNEKEAYDELARHGPEHDDTVCGDEREEFTRYKGCHQMYCQVLQDDKVVALARYDVNIKWPISDGLELHM